MLISVLLLSLLLSFKAYVYVGCFQVAYHNFVAQILLAKCIVLLHILFLCKVITKESVAVIFRVDQILIEAWKEGASYVVDTFEPYSDKTHIVQKMSQTFSDL